MIGRKVLEEREVTLGEVKRIMEARASEGELEYEQRKTLEYAQKFAKLSEEKEEKLLEELQEMGLPRRVAITLVNLMPKTKSGLHAVIMKERLRLKEEDLDEILKKLEEYRG